MNEEPTLEERRKDLEKEFEKELKKWQMTPAQDPSRIPVNPFIMLAKIDFLSICWANQTTFESQEEQEVALLEFLVERAKDLRKQLGAVIAVPEIDRVIYGANGRDRLN